MAKTQTQKNKFKSRYAPDTWISDAQYITEFVCENKARKDGKDLPLHFWQIPVWAKFFKLQILSANGLLKIYEAEAIVKALRTHQGRGIFSLRAPHLDQLIKQEQATLDLHKAKRAEAAPVERASTTTLPRPAKPQSGIISKLKALD